VTVFNCYFLAQVKILLHGREILIRSSLPGNSTSTDCLWHPWILQIQRYQLMDVIPPHSMISGR